MTLQKYPRELAHFHMYFLSFRISVTSFLAPLSQKFSKSSDPIHKNRTVDRQFNASLKVLDVLSVDTVAPPRLNFPIMKGIRFGIGVNLTLPFGIGNLPTWPCPTMATLFISSTPGRSGAVSPLSFIIALRFSFGSASCLLASLLVHDRLLHILEHKLTWGWQRVHILTISALGPGRQSCLPPFWFRNR